MGREIRRVPSDWIHPKQTRRIWTGQDYETVETSYYRPLYDKDYETAAQEWIAEFDQWRAGTHPHQSDDCRYYWEYANTPDEETHRSRKWTDEQATHYQIYETVSEGTPVSPVFATLDELVEWCVTQGYSRYAAEQFAKHGWVPSMVMEMTSGIIAQDIEAAGMFPDKQAN